MTLPPTPYTTTGQVNVNGGTLRADYVNTATTIFNAASNLTFGGGTLNIVGRASGTTAQTMGNLTVNVGGGSPGPRPERRYRHDAHASAPSPPTRTAAR
jgi:hypothetical protein